MPLVKRVMFKNHTQCIFANKKQTLCACDLPGHSADTCRKFSGNKTLCRCQCHKYYKQMMESQKIEPGDTVKIIGPSALGIKKQIGKRAKVLKQYDLEKDCEYTVEVIDPCPDGRSGRIYDIKNLKLISKGKDQ